MATVGSRSVRMVPVGERRVNPACAFGDQIRPVEHTEGELARTVLRSDRRGAAVVLRWSCGGPAGWLGQGDSMAATLPLRRCSTTISPLPSPGSVTPRAANTCGSTGRWVQMTTLSPEPTIS